MSGNRGMAAVVALAALAACGGESETRADHGAPPADTMGAPGTTIGTTTGPAAGAPIDTTSLGTPGAATDTAPASRP